MSKKHNRLVKEPTESKTLKNVLLGVAFIELLDKALTFGEHLLAFVNIAFNYEVKLICDRKCPKMELEV